MRRGLAVAALGVALAVAFTSVQYGVRVALAADGSGDFQWSGAHLLLHGTDPYRAAIEGRHLFVLTSSPNYAPLLLFVLMPLGALSFGTAKAIWLAGNLTMLAVAVVLTARRLGLQGRKLLLAGCLVAGAAPVAIALRGGQQTILVLFAGTLAVRLKNPRAAGVALAIALTKYSFAPLVVGLVLQRRWRTLLVAAGAESGAVLAMCVLTGASLLDALLGPFRVAQGMAQGSGSVFTVLTLIAPDDRVVAYVGAAVAILGLAWWARDLCRRGDWLDQLAVGSAISLLTLPHLIYDYVLLLPVAAVGIRRVGRSRLLVLAPVGVIWFAWLLGESAVVNFQSVAGMTENMLLVLLALGAMVGGPGLHVGTPSLDEAVPPVASAKSRANGCV